jgi:hypothetical protein
MVPPEATIEVAPGAGGQVAFEKVPQEAEAVAGLEFLTVTPAGRLSVNVKPVNPVSGGAVKVKINSEFPPILIVAWSNVFVAATPAPKAYTETGAVESPTFFGPSAVVKSPARIVFV